jgi:hypothetical protein
MCDRCGLPIKSPVVCRVRHRQINQPDDDGGRQLPGCECTWCVCPLRTLHVGMTPSRVHRVRHRQRTVPPRKGFSRSRSRMQLARQRDACRPPSAGTSIAGLRRTCRRGWNRSARIVDGASIESIHKTVLQQGIGRSWRLERDAGEHGGPAIVGMLLACQANRGNADHCSDTEQRAGVLGASHDLLDNEGWCIRLGVLGVSARVFVRPHASLRNRYELGSSDSQ